jgi:signal transduction histidine kinase
MLGLAGLTVALVFVIQHNWQQRNLLSRQHYVESNQGTTVRDAARVEFAFRSIYANLRTLSLLPSVRGIAPHGENLTEEGRASLLQVYENLASSVDVSEVYIAPINLEPASDSIATPVRAFVKLVQPSMPTGDGKGGYITNPSYGTPSRGNALISADSAVIEKSKLRLMIDQAAWLKSRFGNTENIRGFDVPMVSGPEIITNDTRHATSMGNADDQRGVMFSIPFYDTGGKIKGMISAFVSSFALRQLIPSDNIALVNPHQGYVNAPAGVKALKESSKYVAAAEVDPNLIYSRVMRLPIKDARSTWYLWTGKPDSDFYTSKDILTSDSIRLTGLLILAISVFVIVICITLLSRSAKQAEAMAESMRKARDDARRSQAEAQDSTDALQNLNKDISRLNTELADRLKQLSEAQEDIVKKGKLSQLGNLVATVAHELRNPLGSVRTTVFMLQRKLKDSPIDVSPQLQRIEQGIHRCDMIITQLLDFSRSQPANTSNLDLVAWLEGVLQDEAARLPSHVTVKYAVSQDKIFAPIDPERMRRGIVNLISNAVEAMTSGDGPAKMKEAPTITVSLREAYGSVEISVADNGPGIAADILEKVGEPLFTTKSFGTGLGLASVRKMAELHGGGLNVRSLPGLGATFTIWVPQIRALDRSA